MYLNIFLLEVSKANNVNYQEAAKGPAPLPSFEVPPVPPCANGERPVTQRDGSPLLCLPGKHQCPQNYECFFNGINFFCCPNAEDPYDKHVFGGKKTLTNHIIITHLSFIQIQVCIWAIPCQIAHIRTSPSQIFFIFC